MPSTGRPRRIQVRPIRRDEERSGVRERRRERCEELLRGSVSPLHVGQRQDDGLGASDTEDEIADCTVEQLPARLAREGRQREAVAESGQHQLGGLGLHAGDRFGEHAMRDLGGRVRPDSERAAQEIGYRTVRAVYVVRRAACPRDARAERSRVGEQLVHETRLAEPGLSDDGHDVASTGESLLERADEHGDLFVAANEGGAAAVGRRGLDPQKPPRDERRALALGGDRRVWLVCEETRGEPVRGVADKYLTRLRRLLQPGGYVYGVAEDAELAFFVADRARDGEAGVDPDPQREVSARPFGDAFVFAVERAEDGEPGPLRARRMIDLVVARSEDRDDRVADVLLDQAARRADLYCDRVPCGAHVLVELFRIEALGERRESRDVREENRDLFGLALDRLYRDEPRAALPAVAVGDGHLARALRTGDCRSPHRPGEVTSLNLSSGCRRGVVARPPIR